MRRRRVLPALLLAAWLFCSPVSGQSLTQVQVQELAELMRVGDLAEAERRLRTFLDGADDPAARDLLGLVLARSGDTAAAEQEFLRALALAPDHFPARQNLGRLYLRQGRTEDAMRELRRAAGLAPLDRELAIQLAELELGSGQADAGERRLRETAERHDSVRARLDLARSLARRGENRQALDQLRQALDVAPNAEDLLSAYARVLLALGTPQPAIGVLEDLTRIHPSSPDYAYLLGVARLQIAENASGTEALERSVALDPKQPLANIALGLAYLDQQQYAKAQDRLLESLKLMPGNVDALVALAEAQEALDEVELAEQTLDRASALTEDGPIAHYVRGKIRMKQGRYEEARDALLQTIAELPNLAKAHYQLSLVYARLGDRASSQHHRERHRAAQQYEEDRLIELRTARATGDGSADGR